MNFFGFISLFGGLALFLYGMAVMGGSLEKASEGRLEAILERLTGNVFKAVLLGTLVTAVIQSSSATTVIVVGLVNARVLKLRQAVGIIMGANIGTTITAHILRLTSITGDSFALQVVKPSTLAPAMAIIGIVLFLAAKRDRMKDFGQLLLGFGILFTGMLQMEAAVRPLSALPAFARMFTAFTNPILGVLVGAGVTAVIQSSSASVGILQALSSTGRVAYAAAIPLILGQNIGTCITAILASIGTSKNAKRSAAVHLSFNILGTGIFLVGIYGIYWLFGFPFWNDPVNSGGIANFHTMFNVVTTLIFIPFTGFLEKLSYVVIPKGKDEEGQAPDTTDALLEERLMVSPGLAIEHAREAVLQMAKLSQKNFLLAKGLLLGKYDPQAADQIEENENRVDRYQDRIENYLIQLSKRHLTENSKILVAQLLHMIGEFERISDLSENMMEARKRLAEAGASFSETALGEIGLYLAAVEEIVGDAVEAYDTGDRAVAARIEPLEQVIDMMEEELKARHIGRLRDGKCGVDAAFAFVEALSSLERVADHCSNVGVNIINAAMGMERYDTHDYLHALHRGENSEYLALYDGYEKKYLSF